MQSLISVIIPTLNRAHLISETLDSILVQTYEQWECLVIDDGSTDSTKEVVLGYVQKDSRFQFHERPKEYGSGGNGARNYGFNICRGDYVNWFDSDDLMHPEKLERQIKALEETNLSYSVCQTAVFENTKSELLGLRHQRINSENSLLDYIRQDVVFLTQAPLFRRDFLEYYRLLFDEDLKAAQEWDFLSRVLYFETRYQVINEALVYLRKHKDSISHNSNYEERKWHYFLARKKVYDFLKKQGEFKCSNEIFFYLENYFKEYFRELVFSGNEDRISNTYEEVVRPLYSGVRLIKIKGYIQFVKKTGLGYSLRKQIIN